MSVFGSVRGRAFTHGPLVTLEHSVSISCTVHRHFGFATRCGGGVLRQDSTCGGSKDVVWGRSIIGVRARAGHGHGKAVTRRNPATARRSSKHDVKQRRSAAAHHSGLKTMCLVPW